MNRASLKESCHPNMSVPIAAITRSIKFLEIEAGDEVALRISVA
jgi:hypothetical protein